MAAAASRHYAIYQGKLRERIKGGALRRTKTRLRIAFCTSFFCEAEIFFGESDLLLGCSRYIYMWRAAGSRPTSKQIIYMKVNVKYSHQDI